MQNQQTISYYDQNTEEYINRTKDSDFSGLLMSFIEDLPTNSRVLDVGCGSGRDSQFFDSHGFRVTAIDSSVEMAKTASERTGFNVLAMDVLNLPWTGRFDAVWSMASLLHLPKKDFPAAVDKLFKALKHNGKMFIALKEGQGEAFDAEGRFFSYYDEKELRDVFQPYGVEFSISRDIDTHGRGQNWIYIHAMNCPSKKHSFNYPKK